MRKVKFSIVDGVLKAEFPDEFDPLEASIQKWKYIIKNIGRIRHDGSCDTCGLCKTFSCYDCPVGNHEEHFGCVDTPYDLFCADRTIKNAQDELEFLKSLRKG